MPRIQGYEKSLTRDGAGSPINGHAINPHLTASLSITTPITVSASGSYTLSVDLWTSIRFTSTGRLYVSCENEDNEVSVPFPEIPNVPILYILSYTDTLYFQNLEATDSILYIQGM